MKKKDVTDRLYDTVAKYLEAKGGKAIVIGGIEIQTFPGEAKFVYRLAIKFMGRKPK